jgi:hypothetical protein
MATATLVPRVQAERRFFTGMAIAMTLFVFVGFAPTYYLYPLLRVENIRGVAITPMVHLHAAVGSVWMLFLLMQTGLIWGRQHQQHMRNGLIGLAFALAVIVVGVVVALDSARSGRTPPGWTPTGFLVFPLASVLFFGGYVAVALLWRRRPDYHKRLMLLATIALLVPAGARFARHFLAGILPTGPIGGMILTDFFLAAIVAYDLRTKGRIHPVTLWGGLLWLLSQPLRVMLVENAAWNSFAARLIG